MRSKNRSDNLGCGCLYFLRHQNGYIKPIGEIRDDVSTAAFDISDLIRRKEGYFYPSESVEMVLMNRVAEDRAHGG